MQVDCILVVYCDVGGFSWNAQTVQSDGSCHAVMQNGMNFVVHENLRDCLMELFWRTYRRSFFWWNVDIWWVPHFFPLITQTYITCVSNCSREVWNCNRALYRTWHPIKSSRSYWTWLFTQVVVVPAKHKWPSIDRRHYVSSENRTAIELQSSNDIKRLTTYQPSKQESIVQPVPSCQITSGGFPGKIHYLIQAYVLVVCRYMRVFYCAFRHYLNL